MGSGLGGQTLKEKVVCCLDANTSNSSSFSSKLNCGVLVFSSLVDGCFLTWRFLQI